MNSEIWVALLSLLGTLLGSASGVLAAARLTSYRIAQLEKKVERHNGFGEKIPVLEERIKVVNHRLSDLEETVGK